MDFTRRHALFNMKYFLTVAYCNLLPPKNGRWHIGERHIANGFIKDMHPVEWFAIEYERQRKAWNAEKQHTRFGEILFYAELPNNISTDNLQDFTPDKDVK
jgi:hypothetical protein